MSHQPHSALPQRPGRRRHSVVAATAAAIALVTVATPTGGPALSTVGRDRTAVPAAVGAGLAERAAANSRFTIWSAETVPEHPSVRSSARTKLGVVFSASQSGRIAGIRFYRADSAVESYRAQLWDRTGKRLATTTFQSSAGAGWKTVRFEKPVRIQSGERYTAAYVAPHGGYARDRHVLGGQHTVANGPLTAYRGTYGHGAGRPTESAKQSNYYVDVVFRPSRDVSTPSPSAPATEFPGPDDTGVPDGVTLTTYSGSRTITTPGTVIDAQSIAGSLSIQARDVTISRSSVKGNIVISSSGSLTITDTLVDGGTFNGSAVGQYNITMRRTEVIGARQSVSCNANCEIQDSWLHDQYMLPGSDWHGDGFISNGGNNMVLRHNTLACDSEPTGHGGACSAALAAYGDFAPITNQVYDNNLFVSSPAGYCMYAGYDPKKPFGDDATNVRVTNNVFERGTSGKCGVFGAATAVAPAGSGNVFSGNVWDDGESL